MAALFSLKTHKFRGHLYTKFFWKCFFFLTCVLLYLREQSLTNWSDDVVTIISETHLCKDIKQMFWALYLLFFLRILGVKRVSRVPTGRYLPSPQQLSSGQLQSFSRSHQRMLEGLGHALQFRSCASRRHSGPRWWCAHCSLFSVAWFYWDLERWHCGSYPG